MTASAPSGTTPPVEIAIASPGASGRSAGRPAATCPTTGRRPGRSAARTAYPSIAELANGGRSTTARAGSAVTRPAAVPTATLSADSVDTCSSTRACASCMVSNAPTFSAYRIALPKQPRSAGPPFPPYESA